MQDYSFKLKPIDKFLLFSLKTELCFFLPKSGKLIFFIFQQREFCWKGASSITEMMRLDVAWRCLKMSSIHCLKVSPRTNSKSLSPIENHPTFLISSSFVLPRLATEWCQNEKMHHSAVIPKGTIIEWRAGHFCIPTSFHSFGHHLKLGRAGND